MRWNLSCLRITTKNLPNTFIVQEVSILNDFSCCFSNNLLLGKMNERPNHKRLRFRLSKTACVSPVYINRLHPRIASSPRSSTYRNGIVRSVSNVNVFVIISKHRTSDYHMHEDSTQFRSFTYVNQIFSSDVTGFTYEMFVFLESMCNKTTKSFGTSFMMHL